MMLTRAWVGYLAPVTGLCLAACASTADLSTQKETAGKPAVSAGVAGSTERAWPYVLANAHPALHLVGDSTMADKPVVQPPHPERGWGQLLREKMLEPERLVNHAANGRSTRRFVDEGRWVHVMSQLKPGDFVLIQFGHNDQKFDDPRRFAPAQTDYKAYLRSFVFDVRSKGATALLATPVSRRKFDAQGKVVDTIAEWSKAMREVALELDVVLLDMTQLTAKHLQSIGPEASKQQFMWIQPGQWASVPKGLQDDTHYVEAGARATSQIAARALSQQVPALAPWFKAL